MLHVTVSTFYVALTKSLGAESFVHVTNVHVLSFPCLSLVLPASWRDAGPRMGATPVSRHRTRHTTVFTLVSTLWWVLSGSHGAPCWRTIVATCARVTFASVPMHVPTGAPTCDPHSSLCVVLFMTNIFPNMAPPTRVTGHWDCVVVQRLCCGANGLCGTIGTMPASMAGPLPSTMSGFITATSLLAKRTPESGASDLNFRLRRLRTESERKDSGRDRRQRIQVRQLERTMKIVSLRPYPPRPAGQPTAHHAPFTAVGDIRVPSLGASGREKPCK